LDRITPNQKDLTQQQNQISLVDRDNNLLE